MYKFLIDFNDTNVHLLNIYLPYISISQGESKKLFLEQPRLNLLCYYNSPNEIEHPNERSYYSEKSMESRNEHEVSSDYFTINIKLFTESQNHNTYYNRKLAIDLNGNIKNAPEQITDFGNITDISLKEAIKQEKFQRLWYIHKAMIDICKDCEFRHMCVDSCDLEERKDKSWYRIKECSYNPYICKWVDEEGYRTLSECGVEVGEQKFSMNKKKLDSINKELWG